MTTMDRICFAGASVTRTEVRATLAMLRYYRAFLASNFLACRDLQVDPLFPSDMNRGEARRHLTFLIHVAINRKAGIPDVACRKQEPEYQVRLVRDCRGVRDATNRRLRAWGLNGRRWETDEIQARFGHMLDGGPL